MLVGNKCPVVILAALHLAVKYGVEVIICLITPSEIVRSAVRAIVVKVSDEVLAGFSDVERCRHEAVCSFDLAVAARISKRHALVPVRLVRLSYDYRGAGSLSPLAYV